MLTQGRRKLDTLWPKLLFFLYCCSTIHTLHLFEIFFFLSDSKNPLSLFMYYRQIFLVLACLLFQISLILRLSF